MDPDKSIFQVGDFVFAKIVGYRPWPSKVKNVEKCNGSFQYLVKFYGSYDVAVCQEKDLYPYNPWVKENNNRFTDHLQELYERAIRELEEDIEFEKNRIKNERDSSD